MPPTDTLIRCIPNYWDKCSTFSFRVLFIFSISHTNCLKKAKIQVHISMKYKIWNVQYKCNIIKAGQRGLLQLKWPHMTLQVILKCNTADWPLGNPTYTMLPWGWIVLHKINIPHWTRTAGIYSTRYGGLTKLLHVNDQNTPEVQCVIYWSENGEMGAGWMTSSSPLELVNVEGEFEGGAKLQAHVFHHHVTPQQQQRFAVDLLQQVEGADSEVQHEARLSFKWSFAAKANNTTDSDIKINVTDAPLELKSWRYTGGEKRTQD